jgi:predicted glutamine amidotransferase
MCRLFGVAATAPVDISFELLEAHNPLIDQALRHDSGWGIASYEDGTPRIERFPVSAQADPEFRAAARAVARLGMVHVRRATMGGLGLHNTHPFARGPFTYCHNGTILHPRRLLDLADSRPRGETDSEHFFNVLMAQMDPGDVVGSLRRTVELACERCPFSALNFVFSDGRRLYAYRFGVYEMFWLVRNLDLDADTRTHYHLHLERPHGEHVVLVSSEKLTDREPWGEFEQDQLLICDPADPDHPRIEHLLGPRADQIEFVPMDSLDHLSGTARGEWAARRAEAGA